MKNWEGNIGVLKAENWEVWKTITQARLDFCKPWNFFYLHKRDYYSILRCQVYDVSRYVTAHPGKEAILRNVGGDSTEGFRQQPAHRVIKNHIATLLKTFYIGHVLSEEEHTEWTECVKDKWCFT